MKREGLGFLAACKAVDSRNQALEQIRDKGAEIVLAVFRMLKNSLVHAIGNQTIALTVKEGHNILSDFCLTVGGYVNITYVDDTVFVCGQLLRASRGTYDCAMEVGKLLSVAGVAELSFTADVTEENLLALCESFSISLRDPQQRGRLLEAKIPNIQVRKIDTTLQQKQEDTNLPFLERSLRLYASALVVMRHFFERVAEGATVLPHRVKRVARRLVHMVEEDEKALLALTTLVNAHRDEAGRAVQTALLAIMIARRLTEDRIALSQIAMAALMADIGRVRIAGTAGEKGYIGLSDDVERVVPALSSSLCISAGGVNVQNALRTVTVFEATYIERRELLGPIYRRAMTPTVHSKILIAVRALLDKMAPRDTAAARAMSPLDALASLAGAPGIDDTVYKLLIDALGVLPTGTVVEFETGEWGIVVGPSATRGAVARPRVKLITDRAGQVFSKPKEIDLGEAGGKRYPAITGVIEPSRANFNLTGILMGEDKVAINSGAPPASA